VRKSGKRPTDDRPYSLVQVAHLLLVAAELYQEVHSAPSRGYTAPALCPHDRPYYDYERPKNSCRVCAQVTAETHAAIIHRRQNLSDSERERVLDALIDLDVAMGRMSDETRRAIADFVDRGPEWITSYDVEFRGGHVTAVMNVQNAMNGHGKYLRREASEREGAALHRRRAPLGDVHRLSAA
jgi:hypothetical protein